MTTKLNGYETVSVQPAPSAEYRDDRVLYRNGLVSSVVPEVASQELYNPPAILARLEALERRVARLESSRYSPPLPTYISSSDDSPAAPELASVYGSFIGDGGGGRPVEAPALQANAEAILGTGQHMSTYVRLSKNGRLDATTRTWTNIDLRGFTGGVMVFVTDANGNVIAASELQTPFGVDGRWVPFSTSDRTDVWSQQLDPAIIAVARGLYIVHLLTPRPRLGEILNKIVQFVNDAVQFAENIYDILHKLAQDHPEIAAQFAM